MLQTLKAVRMVMDFEWHSLNTEILLGMLLDLLSLSQCRKLLLGHL